MSHSDEGLRLEREGTSQFGNLLTDELLSQDDGFHSV
jgi:hypothetical protein